MLRPVLHYTGGNPDVFVCQLVCRREEMMRECSFQWCVNTIENEY